MEDRYAKMVSSFQMSNPPAVPSRSGPVDAPDIPSFRFDQDATLFLYTMDLHIFSTACMSILPPIRSIHLHHLHHLQYRQNHTDTDFPASLQSLPKLPETESKTLRIRAIL